MNLIRLIILALLIWLIIRLIRRMLTKPDSASAKAPPPKVGTDMVRCAHCGIHIPENEALYRDKHPYCCKEHRQAGPQS